MRKYDPLKPKLDIHQAVTDKIVQAIEGGAGTFEMPWHRPGVSFDIPLNASTGKHYRGSNILSLWIDADDKKFEHQTWATFKQWQELGAQVRKGEKGSLIVKYGEWTPKDAKAGSGDAKPKAGEGNANAGGDDEAARMLYAKAAWVFNCAQVDGYDVAPKEPRPDLTSRLAHVEDYIAATGAEVRFGGQRAYYRHRGSDGQGDFIQMPDLTLFTGTSTTTPTEALYAVELHELGHWTGAKHRLDREFGQRFGDKAYAFEELVAELHAAFQCAGLQITNEPRPDHAQYIATWLELLKDDKKAIFTASSLASRAVAYLDGFQPKPDPDAGPQRPDEEGATGTPPVPEVS